MILACDGIWDCMTSQQVVDFVRVRLAKNIPISDICKEICTVCLAKDVMNDPGTDNMSIVIVQLFAKEVGSPSNQN